jgi:polyprenyl-phospho-N-acetylgalactosaminyl synthase
MSKAVTVVIPAYNESGRIEKTVKDVAPYADEILVIDDCSIDTTADEAVKAGAKVIRQPSNQGYIAAIKKGFCEASGQTVIIIDADGEFPTSRIPDLIQPIMENEADMVQGHRDQVPRISERVLNWLANRKVKVGDSGTGFRALKTGLARQLQLEGACICGVFSLEVVSKGGRISEIPIHLQKVDKPRRVAWYHCRQFFYLLPWLMKSFE